MTSQSRRKRQTTVRNTRTTSDVFNLIRGDRIFLVRVIVFAVLLCMVAGFGNPSTGQDYVGRRSKLVIRNIRDAGTPPKKSTRIRTSSSTSTPTRNDARRPQILRTPTRGWTARSTTLSRSQSQRTRSPQTGSQHSLSDDPKPASRNSRSASTSISIRPAQRTPRSQQAFLDRPSPARSAPSHSPLRWRHPERPSQVAGNKPARQERRWTAARASHDSNRSNQSNVRRAAHLAPLDPFDDPFGDKQAQHTESTESLPEPNRMQSVIRQPTSSTAETYRDAPPSPLFQTGTGGGQNQNTVPQTIKRDCAAELARCRSIERNPLSSISLDITPSLRSSTVRGADAAARRQLQQARARAWKNRAGDVVAEGKLTNLEYGRAVITDSQGTVRRIPVNHLSDADLCVVATLWNLPAECILDQDPYIPRNWLASTLTWKASALCHRPLYFEQVQLERYGHTAGPIVQPLVSGAHFFTSLAFLPYKMGINPPTECRYPLGHYRPGNCAPWLLPPVPLSVRGGLLQAGVVTGAAALLP